LQTRNEKIQLLTRLNEGKKLIPSFLAELSEAIGGQIDSTALATLPDTDSLLETFRAGYQRSKTADGMVYQRYFRSHQKAKLFEISDCIGKRLSAETTFLITKNSHFCGAVRTDILATLGHAASIIRLDGDSVCLVSEDRQQGLLIDQNLDDPEQTYELTVWGNRWSSAVSYCESSGG
jgi:hypothetical protein